MGRRRLVDHLAANTLGSWQDDAACRNADPEIFFPTKTEGWIAQDAKKICWEDCPVREQCLDHALALPERHGIWGGYTYMERRAMLKESA